MMRMDSRVTSFAETQEGSATDWESETEGAAAPITGMRPAGISDEDWEEEEDLDMGYHPTSKAADVPPVVEDERIEGARSALPPDNCLQEDAGMCAETTVGTTRHQPADKIIAADSLYGNPEVEHEMDAAEDDDQEDNDHDVVVEETCYERGEEELDYDDDAPVEEEMAVQDDDSDPGDEDKDGNADDEGEDDVAATGSVRPKKGKDAPVWGRLGTPVGDKSTTDTETGETAEMMKSVLIGSPDGNQTAEKNESRRRSRSDRESTVLSDGGRRSRGHSSDSSRSSCPVTGSKRRRDRREKEHPEPVDSSQLNAPEATTPQQLPCQKQIKMTEPSSRPTSMTPAVSSVVQLAEMPAQDLMHARLNDMEQRITGVSGEPSPPSSPIR